MEDFDLIAVSQKSVKGFFALTSRTFFIKVLSVITSFILTIYLDRQSYGIYFIASSLVTFLVYFQDIGLAASLIQKKEPPTQEEYATTFTIQQLLVLVMVIPALVFSQNIAHFYHMNIEGLWLFQALVVSFFISSLKTIPTVILERQLSFHKLVIPDLVENLVYNLCLIFFVIGHMGITSFTIAVLARSILGLFVIYYIQPWKIQIRFDIDPLKKLIRFGIPFQANSLLAVLKDNLVNVYIGKVLPFDQVGVIGFAQKLSFLPSNLVMDNVIRVTFPAYSRLQHDKEALKIVIEHSLFLIAACIFPMVIGFITLSHGFINTVPIGGYKKWEPSTFSIIFFSLNILFAAITVPITNFLNAIGKVKLTLYAMIGLTILTWVLTPVCILFFKYNGVAIASFIVSASLIAIVPLAQKEVRFSFFKPLVRPVVAAVCMCLFLLFTNQLIHTFLFFVVLTVCSIVLYAGVLYLLSYKQMKNALAFLRNK